LPKGVRGPEGPVVWALFRDAAGLVDKSRVQVAGLIIGEIAERRLQGTYARVSNPHAARCRAVVQRRDLQEKLARCSVSTFWRSIPARRSRPIRCRAA
jgi:hypothetical protein